MSIGPITGSGSTSSLIDAIRVWRAGAVTAGQAVSNQTDPRGHVQVDEQSSAQRRQPAVEARNDRPGQRSDAGRRSGGERQSASGPSSAFLAQFLAQSQEAPAIRAGTASGGAAAQATAAYSQASGLAASLPGDSGEHQDDILPPPGSEASGRGIDLVV